jgi:hypothetical protein
MCIYISIRFLKQNVHGERRLVTPCNYSILPFIFSISLNIKRRKRILFTMRFYPLHEKWRSLEFPPLGKILFFSNQSYEFILCPGEISTV